MTLMALGIHLRLTMHCTGSLHVGKSHEAQFKVIYVLLTNNQEIVSVCIVCSVLPLMCWVLALQRHLLAFELWLFLFFFIYWFVFHLLSSSSFETGHTHTHNIMKDFWKTVKRIVKYNPQTGLDPPVCGSIRKFINPKRSLILGG